MFDVFPRMKTPPFLLLATLAFWGWQSGLLWVGVALGGVLESSRFIRARFDLADEDFRRIWNLCIVLTLAVAAIVFTTNDEGGGGLISNPTVSNASNATVHTATTLLRWLPMTLFLFVAAQKFSERGLIPLSAISLVFKIRKRRSADSAWERPVDVSYPYFIVCLFAAGFHANQGTHTYFLGLAILFAWALWPARSRRFGIFVWLAALMLAIALGYGGTRGIGLLVQASQSFDARLLSWMLKPKTDARQSITSMGYIGKLKLSPRIVIRLEPINDSLAPTYLREATYRSYHSQNQAWQAGSAGNEFADVSAEAGGLNWLLLPGITNNSAARIACYLNGWSADLKVPEGLLPLPTGSSRLEKLPVIALKMNKTGAVLASGPGLVIFNARFGSGATFDSLPDAGTNLLDASVPTNELAALNQVISEMNVSGADEEHKLQAVQSFFASKFTYSLWQGRDKLATTNATPLARFLLSSRSGHCEYFATATVLLLRELGIPARYAVGYAVHETRGKSYVVRERDAHAWCLAWDSREKIWKDFDTTPGSWIAAEEQRASAWQWLSDGWSWLRFQIAKFRWGQTNLRQYILWGMVPVIAVLLFQIIFRRRKRKAAQGKESAEKIFWPGLDSEFYQLETKLAARGVPRQPSEPLADWLERALAEPALAGLRAPLLELLHLHYRYRFDPHGLADHEKKLLVQKVDSVLEILSQK
jgi:hypothetical protein